MSPTEEVLFSKFEVGLNLGIRERMAVLGNKSLKEVVQSALRIEHLVKNGKHAQENMVKRRSLEVGQHYKKRKSDYSSKGSSALGPIRPPPPQSSDQQRCTHSDSTPCVTTSQ